MKRLRLWLQSRRDESLRSLLRELAEIKQALNTERYEHRHTLEQRDRNHLLLSGESAILGAVLKGIGFETVTPAAAQHAVGAHIDARLQAIEVRASQAERIAEDLRSTLTDERREHDQTRGALNASEAENAEAWRRVEKIRAQTAADIAIQARRKAIAETDARRKPEDDESA